MIRLRIPYFLLILIGVLQYCTPPEEEITRDGDLDLVFSTDTVLFDTLLSARTSITRRLRIFNPHKNAIEIERISLGQGRQSPYDIIVNGKPGSEIERELVFGGDSLLVLVDVEIDPQDQDSPYLVKDSVIVEWNGNQNDVKLVAWGQDANYLVNPVICDEVWTADRPYVLFGSVLVDSLCNLTMEPGTRVFVDNGVSLFVLGDLVIQGDSNNIVTLRNTRFDANYIEAPGQWEGLVFFPGSTGQVDYATIENANNGIFSFGTNSESDQVSLRINHTTLRHMATAGIQAFTSIVSVTNTEVFNCGSFLIGNYAGGDYTYDHCTFSNEPNFFIRDEPSVQFSDNIILTGDQLLTSDLSVRMRNSIIWGSMDEELIFGLSGTAGVIVDTTFSNNIIRSAQVFPGNETSLQNNFPGFLDPFLFNYELDSLSFAIDKGLPLGIPDDIRGRVRDANPDIGAFERIEM
ncbi:MAG: hypothetical protein KI790_15795 [Cyclobacteriaceae bacterium]|nr:hypothetical protein [Cyclobacteriaceae bacterium HetDA_MAG_MS6]